VLYNTLKITLLSASSKRDVPTFFSPSRLTFAQTVNNFVLLCIGHFGVEDILTAEIIWRMSVLRLAEMMTGALVVLFIIIRIINAFHKKFAVVYSVCQRVMEQRPDF
jgi:hypothetical protein